jgi:hypothetical protein
VSSYFHLIGDVPVHDFETPICIYAARGMRVI